MDTYDALHYETGSSNISKATPEWQEILRQVRQDLTSNHAHGYVLHTAYALVNEQTKNDVPWCKCMNCGSPYIMTNTHKHGNICSDECTTEILNDIMNT